MRYLLINSLAVLTISAVTQAAPQTQVRPAQQVGTQCVASIRAAYNASKHSDVNRRLESVKKSLDCTALQSHLKASSSARGSEYGILIGLFPIDVPVKTERDNRAPLLDSFERAVVMPMY
jgi:hypothetical protein